MKHKTFNVFSVLALVQMACGPLITVINNTPEKVRVIIKFEDNSYTVLPAPKEYKEVEVKWDLTLPQPYLRRNGMNITKRNGMPMDKYFKIPKI
jgi:hypothetical protein